MTTREQNGRDHLVFIRHCIIGEYRSIMWWESDIERCKWFTKPIPTKVAEQALSEARQRLAMWQAKYMEAKELYA